MSTPEILAAQEALAARAAEWSAAGEMNALEALMWRAEADPRLRATITAVELLDRPPDWDRLHASHDWATRMIPRFRQRVVEPPLGLGPPRWSIDPDWDLDRHLHRVTLAPPGTMRQLLDLAESIASEPFDRAHPPLEAVVVEGLEGGRAAFILKMHHSHTDGVGGMQLLGLLHSPQREPLRDKPQPPPPDPPAHEPSATELLAGEIAHELRELPGAALRAVGDALRAGRRAAAHPDSVTSETLRYARSFARVVTPPPCEPSPLLRPRSLRWRFEVAEVPLAALRAAGKAAGGSVNDAFLAALLGTFRRYHDHFGVSLAAMPVAIPVSLRTGDHPLGGNQFSGVRFAAPVGEPDVRRRIARVRRVVLEARAEPALAALGAIAPLFARLPAPLLARVSGALTQTNDLQASNVAGIPRPVYMAGARITHLFPFGPLPGCAAMITLVSHDGRCCIGANLDRAAITDPDLFAACLHEGFAEVLDLRDVVAAGGAGPRNARAK